MDGARSARNDRAKAVAFEFVIARSRRRRGNPFFARVDEDGLLRSCLVYIFDVADELMRVNVGW